MKHQTNSKLCRLTPAHTKSAKSVIKKQVSPAEALSAGIHEQPLRKLADEDRHILATRRKYVTVGRKGILMKIRGEPHLYFNEHTGRLIGTKVLVLFNIETLDLLTIFDQQRQQHFSVRRCAIPAMTASPEKLAKVNSLINEHMAEAKKTIASA